MSVAELQKYTAVSKYARHLKDQGRREVWSETVERSKQMMTEKYPGRAVQIRRLYDEFVLPMKVLPSMRGLQFGGPPLFKHNSRIFNCWGSYVDRLSFFGEAFYILLCGGGVGYSVQVCHMRSLPNFSRARLTGRSLPKKVYRPDDSIEGWANCGHVQMSSYHERPVPGFEEWMDCDVEFDLSGIRKKNSPLSYGVGRAPGPMPLGKALKRNKKLLDMAVGSGLTRMTDELASDVHLNNSDAVVSGGVRRSANICLFDLRSERMRRYKTGDWRSTRDQRARANISAVLVRGQVNWEQFWELFGATKEFGEPGFWWCDHEDYITNPCQPAFAPIITPDGLRTMGDIEVGSRIWTETGWATVVKKWSTGVKPVFRYRTAAGTFIGTANHRILQNGQKVEAGNASAIDTLAGPADLPVEHDAQLIMDGLVLGDGTVHKASGDLILLCIGKYDTSYHDSEIRHLVGIYRPGVSKYMWEVATGLLPSELPRTFERRIPDRYKFSDVASVRSFLRGLFSANGSVVGKGKLGRATLKTSSRQIADDVQLMLSLVGIRSYVTVNKPAVVSFKNGDYKCKQSYDVNISADLGRFAQTIGFLQPYKRDKLWVAVEARLTVENLRPKTTYEITEAEPLGEMEVFDITVDNEPHTYWTGGCNVSNCAEIQFYARLLLERGHPDLARLLLKYDGPLVKVDGKVGLSGWQACNLTTQNGKLVKTPEDLYELSDAAAELGTYQAGFTSFPYLGEITERIVEKEALLGVSIAGVMHNPAVMLEPAVLQEAARRVRLRNQETADAIGINRAARLTCEKPDGNSACTLGSFSGAHPGKIRRGFRMTQENKGGVPYQFFKSVNPEACEPSCWNPNQTDDVIRFCVEYDGLLEDDMTALEFLGHVRTLRKHWVEAGTVPERCSRPGLTHNVSCTVKVRNHEWGGVAREIFVKQQDFGGVSFISDYGDRDYPQAPFTPVFLPDELLKMYGGHGVVRAGDMVDILPAGPSFRLWDWCDMALGIREKTEEAADWLEQFRQVSEGVFGGDVRRTTYAVKDVFNLRLWQHLRSTYRPVDYTEMKEEVGGVNFQGEISCAAGACET